MLAQFGPALQKVLRHEGVAFCSLGHPVPGRTGYVWHPEDPGGETNFGVTVGTARANGYDGPMTDIPYPTVEAIYRRGYWDGIMGDHIPDQQIAEEMFDTAVNCGVRTVVEFLQISLNALNRRATLYPDIEEDGRMGPTTMTTLCKCLEVRRYHRLCLLRCLDSLQLERYARLVKKDKRYETFFPGWVRVRCGVPEEAA
jgi:lysozyme family protein